MSDLDEKLQRPLPSVGRPIRYQKSLVGRLGYQVLAQSAISREPVLVGHRSMDTLYVWEVGSWDATAKDFLCHLVAEYSGTYDDRVKDFVEFRLRHEWAAPVFEPPAPTQMRQGGRRVR